VFVLIIAVALSLAMFGLTALREGAGRGLGEEFRLLVAGGAVSALFWGALCCIWRIRIWINSF